MQAVEIRTHLCEGGADDPLTMVSGHENVQPLTSIIRR